MMARQTLILEALGLGPRWLPRLPLATPSLAAPSDDAGACAAAADVVAEPCLPAPIVTPDTPPASVADLPSVYAPPDTDAAQPADALTMPEVAQRITAPAEDAPALAEPDRLLASLPLDEPSVDLMPAPPESLPSWAQLQAQVAACQRCRLSQSRTQTVFGRGNPAARWLFVGEAPGEQEDLQGLPFVGPAGKLLDNMLAALGLDREQDIYIANVLKCRPPKNRNPQGDEIAACQPYLRQQIALQQPAVIVALGRFAAQTLLDSEASIGSLRGRVHQYAGVPLVVSYHPAYLLRSLPEKAKAWQDLLRARQVAQTGG
ncbi:MAG: hypothetical protein RI925_353 [Pseudomonadota bacterium]|uniref:uracil-DNA glycosylase n=1 Tax=Aquaspirillum sp. LM1 TaxID=1938604 RepID=UPI00209AE4FC|nr:uracil-DNA glycosylase [Aquaspirillum sp. LM1]